MPEKLSTACELAGLVLVAAAVGALAGLWWGVLVAGVILVVLGIALGAPALRPPEAKSGRRS